MSRYSEAVEQGYEGRSPFDEALRQAWLKAHGLPDPEAEPEDGGHTTTYCPICGGDCERAAEDGWTDDCCEDCGYEIDDEGGCLCTLNPEPGETPEGLEDVE